MKRTAGAAARRYARALLEVAFSSAQGDPAALRRELGGAAELLAEQEELREALLHPAFPVPAKQKVIAEVWAGASPLLRRLLSLLVERGRLGLLEPIAQAFGELWNAARGVVRAEAVSASPLSAAEQEQVARALGRLTGRDVELVATADPAVLGGLQVRIGGVVYDGTVRGRLRALRERLEAPAAD